MNNPNNPSLPSLHFSAVSAKDKAINDIAKSIASLLPALAAHYPIAANIIAMPFSCKLTGESSHLLRELVLPIEQELAKHALVLAKGNKVMASKLLGVSISKYRQLIGISGGPYSYLDTKQESE